MEYLREVSGDATLTLQKIEAGSVKLIFRSTEEGFNKVQQLSKRGRLTRILGFTVQGVAQILLTVASKRERARAWVNYYATAVAVPHPGVRANLHIDAMKQIMCHEIGKIYRGDDYSLEEAIVEASMLDLSAFIAKALTLEGLNFIPILDLTVRLTVVGSIIRELGSLIIAYYEQSED